MPLYCADTVAQKPGRAALLTLYVQTDRVTRFLLDGLLRIVGKNKRIQLLNPPKTPMITHILFFTIWTFQKRQFSKHYGLSKAHLATFYLRNYTH